MRRNPLFIFAGLQSKGIYDVPLKSTVHVVDSDGHGKPMFLQLVAKFGLNPESTINNLYKFPTDYINLSEVGEVYSELEKIQESSGSGSGEGIGWRILGRNPKFYGNIGTGAIDLSYNNIDSDKLGALGRYAIATGLSTSAWGDVSFVAGEGNEAGYSNQFVVGQFNSNKSNTIFEVGIGIGSGIQGRKNALEITKDGILLAPELNVSEITDPKTLVTKEFIKNSYGEGKFELVKYTEGGNTGWRIAGRDIDNYRNIGQEAIDFSRSTMRGTANGASGSDSFAAGLNVISRNQSGASFGQYNEPKIDSIFEIGNGANTAGNIRGNALEIYLDGRIIAPTLTSANIDTDGKSLVTREYLQTSTMSYQLENIDITSTNVGAGVYRMLTPSAPDLSSVDVYNNGLLLREGLEYEYQINIFSSGVELSFTNVNYTLHVGDWLRVKIPSISTI